MTAPGGHDLTSLPVPVGLVTYSVKPRGGVVHTLALAEALHAAGYPVRVIALGDPAAGFFRPVQVPFTIIEAPPSLPTLEERVFANVDALASGLGRLAAEYPILHTQDCISARAACRVRDTAGGGRSSSGPSTTSTTSPAPRSSTANARPSSSPIGSWWSASTGRKYSPRSMALLPKWCTTASTSAVSRRPIPPWPPRCVSAPAQLADRSSWPWAGSSRARAAIPSCRPSPLCGGLAAARYWRSSGGHSFQDYREYRDRVLSSLPRLGLRLDDDVVLLGTVPDAELPGWYDAADVLAFPSTKEGWGLAVLEAMSAGLPVVVSDLPVFREYLRPGRDALMVPVNDPVALAAALTAVLDDRRLADSLRSAGRALCARFTWARSAAEHQKIYAQAGAWPGSSRSTISPAACPTGRTTLDGQRRA